MLTNEASFCRKPLSHREIIFRAEALHIPCENGVPSAWANQLPSTATAHGDFFRGCAESKRDFKKSPFSVGRRDVFSAFGGKTIFAGCPFLFVHFLLGKQKKMDKRISLEQRMIFPMTRFFSGPFSAEG